MKNIFAFILSTIFLSTITATPIDPITRSIKVFPSSYIDSFIEAKMAERKVPGSIVTVVYNGEIIYNKGFGYADIEMKRVIDPNKTVFRVASISKTFTTIGILQLVDAGKLDLHADLRPMIEADFDTKYPFPITIHHILTHTSGFDHSSIGSHQGDAGAILSVQETLRGKLPPMVLEPGSTFWYSNKAYGMLGHVIEKASGVSYETYMKTNILDPLEMKYSTFEAVLPSEINRYKAETYAEENGLKVKEKRQRLPLPSASSLEVSGGDMAKYMIALLDPSILINKGILSAKMIEKLMTSQYNPGNNTESIAYSFFVSRFKNHTSLTHGGGVRGFLSVLDIIPDAGLGVFVSQSNRYGSEPFGWEVKWAIQDTMIDVIDADFEELIENGNMESIPLEKFAGTYRRKNYNRSTFEKAELIIYGQNIEIPVEVIGDNKLSIDGRPFKRIGQTLFAYDKENSEFTNGFILDEHENVKELAFSTGLISQYDKISWYQKAIVQQLVFGSAFLILFSQFLLLFKMMFRKKKVYASKELKLYEWWKVGMSSGYVVSFLGILAASFLIGSVKNGVSIGYKLPLIGMTVTSVFSVLFPLALWTVFKSKSNRFSKIFNTLVIISIVALTFYFREMNLIGFKY